MLLPSALRERIARGDVTLLFRRWRRLQARPGGRHRLNADTVLVVDAADTVDVDSVTANDASRAGFPDRASLVADIRRHGGAPDALLYRIAVHVERDADPRAALAASADLREEEIAAITAKLDALDRRSAVGPWTRPTLDLIGAHPGRVSTELAAMLGRERFAFKSEVRKLKALGLTNSLDVGYELSARGRAYLRSTRGR